MDSRIQNIINHQSKNLNSIIKSNYSASYLNDTKWEKLIESLTDSLGEVFINYKLVYDNVIEGHLIDCVDFQPYFIEPITYQEVEWIEFPNSYEDWVNKNNLKAGKKIYNQDLKKIKEELNKVGQFKIDNFGYSIKLYAYQVKN
tara:strand:- start:50 stop:481 length:432 start_codon:yes stop_codon:yes gene_type:complete